MLPLQRRNGMGYRPRRDISSVSARVVVDKDDALVTLRNASSSGAFLQKRYEEAEIGDALTLQIRDKRFTGKIAWTSDSGTGVVFDTPLRPAELALFTGRASGVSTTAKARVGFVGHAALRK